MRVGVDVAAADSVMAWGDVHGPARAMVYRLIGRHDPALAKELHDSGWRGSTLRPVGGRCSGIGLDVLHDDDNLPVSAFGDCVPDGQAV
jgi:hypothetical protein